jgi:hypothetical protein
MPIYSVEAKVEILVSYEVEADSEEAAMGLSVVPYMQRYDKSRDDRRLLVGLHNVMTGATLDDRSVTWDGSPLLTNRKVVGGAGFGPEELAAPDYSAELIELLPLYRAGRTVHQHEDYEVPEGWHGEHVAGCPRCELNKRIDELLQKCAVESDKVE